MSNKLTGFTILHLSDTHFKATDDLADLVLEQLFKVLEKLAKTDSSPDLILFTGDVAFSGQKEEYEIAAKFFDRILEVTGVKNKKRLFVIPGNHDVDVDVIKNNKAIRKYTKRIRNGKEEDSHGFFQSKENIGLFIKKFNDYQNFSRKYLERKFDEANHYFAETLEVNGFKVSIAGLNSAWLASKKDSERREQQLLGLLPLSNALKKLHNADFRIVLFHHPWHWLLDYEQNDIKGILESDADLAFYGHQVKSDLEPVEPTPIGLKRFCYIQGGPAYNTQGWSNRFYLIRFGVESKDTVCKAIEVIPYKFDLSKMVWSLDTTMFPDDPDYIRRVTLSEIKTRPEMVIPELQTLINELNGELLNSEKLSHPSSREAIFDFYCGAPLTWSLIAANGDIRRKQENEVLDLALTNVNDFQIVSIVAEPGAGKSTLAWRVARELFRRRDFVIRFNSNKSELWSGDKLWRLAKYIGRPFYLLIDDIFRNRQFVEELNYMTKDGLPVSVLGTSRYSEFHILGLERFVKNVELRLLKEERQELLDRLGKSNETLSEDEQHVFSDDKTLLLVLGMVLTKGKGFNRIIESIINSLMEGSGSLYSAFQYVCLSGKYGISVPEVLLSNLDGALAGILEKEQAKGIFYEDPQLGSGIRFIRVGHQVIAEEAVRQFKISDRFKPQFNAPALYKRMIEAADEEDPVQRIFIANLTGVISSEGEDQDAKEILDEISINDVKIGKLLDNASISELDVWKTIFSRMSQPEGVERCSQTILSRVPMTSSECYLLAMMHLERHTGKALLTMEHWMEKNPDDATVLSKYLSLISRIGDRDQKHQSVTKAIDWLRQHPEDRIVRTTLFSVLRKKGYEVPAEQIDQIINETMDWLENNSQETVVREGFLVMVRDLGNANQVDKAIKATFSWLKDHPDDSNTRSVFATLIRDKGLVDRGEIKEALRDLEQYMQKNGMGKHAARLIFQNYITLVRKIDKTAIGLDIDDKLVKLIGNQFLGSCNWADEVKTIENFADWHRDRKEFQEAESIYQRLESLQIQNNRTMAGICFGYGKLLLGEAMNTISVDERLTKLTVAEEKFRKALSVHRRHHVAHIFLSITLSELGKQSEADKKYSLGLWCAPFDFDIRRKMTLCSTVAATPDIIKELNEGKIPATIRKDFEAIRKPLSINARLIRLPSIKNRWKIVDGPEIGGKIYLVLLEKMKEKENYIKTYSDFSFGECFYKTGVFYYQIGRLNDALQWLDIAAEEDPGDFANWWNLGRVEMDLANALEQEGQLSDVTELNISALCSLQLSLKLSPPCLQLPALEDIPARIDECKRRLERFGLHDYLVVCAFKGRDGNIVGRTVEGKIALFDTKYARNKFVTPGDVVSVIVARSERTFDIVRVVGWIQ
jgi:tetratricopeptide (TPR) repeat protein